MNDKIKMGSNRSFGIVFSIVFFLITFYPLLKNENIRTWSLALCIIFLILGLINSSVLTPLNRLWTKIGIYLGIIVSPIVMGIIFFGVVTPTSFLMRLLKKDLLDLKFSNKQSYWIIKKDPKSKMKKQF